MVLLLLMNFGAVLDYNNYTVDECSEPWWIGMGVSLLIPVDAQNLFDPI